MTIWKQLILSAFALVLAGAGAARLSPAVADFLTAVGVAAPLQAIGLIAPKGEAKDARQPPQAGRPAPTVVVQAAGIATINDKVTALGTGTAVQSVTVLPSASGTLVQIDVTSGARVSAGQVIAHLDARAAELALERARLAAKDARRTLERNRVLVESNAAPANQTQAVELAAQMADLALRSAEKDAADRIITAPISGVLGILKVSVGNAVTPQTAIATIDDASSLDVNFWLSERLAGQIGIGDSATLVPVARPEARFAGQITAVDNRIDPASGTFQVQARVDNLDDSLRAGMSFTVSMQFAGQSHVTVNPLAVQWGSDGAYVWRVTDGKAERVPVRIVQRNTETVLVAGEIAQGDSVVTEGIDGLKPGAEVRLSGDTAPPDADPKPVEN